MLTFQEYVNARETELNESTGRCRECGKTQRVDSRGWARSGQPRCSSCGGMLDRTDKHPLFRPNKDSFKRRKPVKVYR